MYKLLLLLFIVIFSENRHMCDAASGTFWHVSDIHVDQNYSRTGDPQHFCHDSATIHSSSDNGLYGNFLCDSPLMLVNVTVESMEKLQPKPDFIIWTGDNLPHVWNPDPDWSAVFEALNNITDLLQNSFPGVPIFPCIGNHDSFPPDILLPQPNNDSIYINYLKKGGWEKLIPPSSWPTFRLGGFYSALIRPGLRLVSLNTILWYMPNKQVQNMTDPAKQFQWLEGELQNATSLNEKVYIIGHVPPGFYNKVVLPLRSALSPLTYHLQFLKQYLNVTGRYYTTIAGQFFGHLHLDTFQLFQYDTGVTRSSSLLASSVTPWHSKKLEGLSLPVNPSVRLMHYEQENGLLTDYNQYFLNLSKVNEQLEQKPQYELLYTFTTAYEVPDVSTKSLNKLYEKLKSSDETFRLFNHHMTAGKYSVPCDKLCRTTELCAIICTSLEEYLSCMEISHSNATVTTEVATTHASVQPHGSHSTLYAIMGSLIVILVLVSLVAFFRLRKRGSRSQGQYERFFEF